MKTLSLVLFTLFFVGCSAFCLFLIWALYKGIRGFERKNAEIVLSSSRNFFVPTSKTLDVWKGQLEAAGIMDLDERTVFRNLQRIIMGELSLRYGDRFSLLYKIPLCLLLREREMVVDGELREIIQGSLVDYLICTEGISVSPAIAIFVWNGSTTPFECSCVVRFTEIDRKLLTTEGDMRAWAVAGVLEGAGVPSYFVERNSLDVLAGDNGEYVIIDSLTADLQNALQDNDLCLTS